MFLIFFQECVRSSPKIFVCSFIASLIFSWFPRVLGSIFQMVVDQAAEMKEQVNFSRALLYQRLNYFNNEGKDMQKT